MDVEWKQFDYNDKPNTAPPKGKLVWIHDEYYHGVTLGQFDGFTMVTYWGSDDLSVTHWAELEHPTAPEVPDDEAEGDD